MLLLHSIKHSDDSIAMWPDIAQFCTNLTVSRKELADAAAVLHLRLIERSGDSVLFWPDIACFCKNLKSLTLLCSRLGSRYRCPLVKRRDRVFRLPSLPYPKHCHEQVGLFDHLLKMILSREASSDALLLPTV